MGGLCSSAAKGVNVGEEEDYCRSPDAAARSSLIGAGAAKPAKRPQGPAASNRSPTKEEDSALASAQPLAAEDLWREVEDILGTLDPADDRQVCIKSYSYGDDLNGYCILGKLPASRKRRLVEVARMDNILNRSMGSMCGMGVGDALGHPYEFMPAQDTPGKSHFDLAGFRFCNESNVFRLERGQWTDDAAMGLCMADSLIMKRGFDGGDMRVRFWCWWNRGYNNAFRKDPKRSSSVGLGGNISKSLQALSRLGSDQAVPPAFKASGEDAGNGSLMRFTPISIFLHTASFEEVHDVARKSSYTTHPGIVAAEACSLLAHLIVRALRLPEGEPRDVRRFLDEATEEYLHVSGLAKKSGWGYDQMKELVTASPAKATERCWQWKSESLDIAGTLRARGHSYNGYPVSSGYFGSYSLDGLAMALWCVYHTTNFNDAVVRSVNLLGDADSHGSITGQLAGALYGYGAIHPRFIEWLTKWDDHDFAVRAVLLNHLGANRAAARGPEGESAGDRLKEQGDAGFEAQGETEPPRTE